MSKRKRKAQDEFAKLFDRREQLIEALVKTEIKLKYARRALARISRAEIKKAAALEEPDLMSDSLEIPGLVRLEYQGVEAM